MKVPLMTGPSPLTFLGDEAVALAADSYGTPNRGTVLLAHGGGQTRHAWAKTGERLAAAGWRAVALDLRGHGDSGWSPTGDYRMHRFAADIVRVANQLGDKPALVGASLGGIAGMMVETLVAPATFSSLTLVDITPRMEADGVAKVMGFMSARVADGFASLEEAAETIASYMPNRPRRTDLTGLGKNLRRHPDGRYRWHWDPRFVTSVMESRDTHSMEDFRTRVGDISIPVHLIRGRMSELVSQEAAQEFLTMLPQATFTDVENAGHMVAGDRNDAFIEAVVGFLSLREAIQ
ncbi:MAG: alpha/beta hydrolase [Lacisediminimonas sp.]|nr:alpha/beta hydrolase [Lacisediminimonas sp.]